MSWQPTHRIVFTPNDGSPVAEWTVMLCKDPYSQESFVGLTEDDWLRQKVPTWTQKRSDGAWLWKGFPTPQWKEGAVAVTELGEAPPKTLRYSRPLTSLR